MVFRTNPGNCDCCCPILNRPSLACPEFPLSSVVHVMIPLACQTTFPVTGTSLRGYLLFRDDSLDEADGTIAYGRDPETPDGVFVVARFDPADSGRLTYCEISTGEASIVFTPDWEDPSKMRAELTGEIECDCDDLVGFQLFSTRYWRLMRQSEIDAGAVGTTRITGFTDLFFCTDSAGHRDCDWCPDDDQTLEWQISGGSGFPDGWTGVRYDLLTPTTYCEGNFFGAPWPCTETYVWGYGVTPVPNQSEPCQLWDNILLFVAQLYWIGTFTAGPFEPSRICYYEWLDADRDPRESLTLANFSAPACEDRHAWVRSIHGNLIYQAYECGPAMITELSF